MTQALCLNCGELKFGVWRPCSNCGVASSGHVFLDIHYSDHNYSPATLEELGQVIHQIAPAYATAVERLRAFHRYVCDLDPELQWRPVSETEEARVSAILDCLDLPEVKLEHSLAHKRLKRG